MQNIIELNAYYLHEGLDAEQEYIRVQKQQEYIDALYPEGLDDKKILWIIADLEIAPFSLNHSWLAIKHVSSMGAAEADSEETVIPAIKNCMPYKDKNVEQICCDYMQKAIIGYPVIIGDAQENIIVKIYNVSFYTTAQVGKERAKIFVTENEICPKLEYGSGNIYTLKVKSKCWDFRKETEEFFDYMGGYSGVSRSLIFEDEIHTKFYKKDCMKRAKEFVPDLESFSVYTAGRMKSFDKAEEIEYVKLISAPILRSYELINIDFERLT